MPPLKKARVEGCETTLDLCCVVCLEPACDVRLGPCCSAVACGSCIVTAAASSDASCPKCKTGTADAYVACLQLDRQSAKVQRPCTHEGPVAVCDPVDDDTPSQCDDVVMAWLFSPHYMFPTLQPLVMLFALAPKSCSFFACTGPTVPFRVPISATQS